MAGPAPEEPVKVTFTSLVLSEFRLQLFALLLVHICARMCLVRPCVYCLPQFSTITSSKNGFLIYIHRQNGNFSSIVKEK